MQKCLPGGCRSISVTLKDNVYIMLLYMFLQLQQKMLTLLSPPVVVHVLTRMPELEQVKGIIQLLFGVLN